MRTIWRDLWCLAFLAAAFLLFAPCQAQGADPNLAPAAVASPDVLISRLRTRDQNFDYVLIRIETSESMKPVPRSHPPVLDAGFARIEYPRKYRQTVLLSGDDRAYVREQDPSMFDTPEALTTPWGEERLRIVCSTQPNGFDLLKLDETSSPTVHHSAEGAAHRFDLVALSVGVGFSGLIDKSAKVAPAEGGLLVRGTCNPTWGPAGSSFEARYDDDLILRALAVRSPDGSVPINMLRLTTSGTTKTENVPDVAASCTLELSNTFPREGREALQRWHDDYLSKTIEVKRVGGR